MPSLSTAEPRPAAPDLARARAALTVKPGFLIRRMMQTVAARFSQPRSQTDLTLTQFETLSVVAAQPGADQSTAARCLGMDRSTMTVVVDTLSRRGLVERRPTSDRRRRLLALTPAADKLLPAAKARHRAADDHLAGRLSPRRSEALREALRSVASHSGALAAPWTPLATHAPGAAAGPGDLDYLYRSFALLTRRCCQIWSAHFMAVASRHEITPGQYSLLFMVEAAGEIDQFDLALLAGGERSTADLVVRLLEKRGLVDRRIDRQDRRRRIAWVTGAGRDLLAELGDSVRHTNDRTFGHLGQEGLAEMSDSLRAIIDAPGPPAA